ncbi:Hypothetical_protein [Hexamita inflata]|uniref:Hypothetical_protein n=1 Tax=Hexamita inflata TaxID=28002 RepID=A0AA86TPC7_9EUKA|nr:Hypothetical protein HINF_LOCUS2982 [Hexamita inflata]CAI9923726.1 Hypothetical protein HINF_LOCUS11371 [Hexamita inflata]
MRLLNFYLQHITLNNDRDKLSTQIQLKISQEQNLKDSITIDKQKTIIQRRAVIQAEFHIHLYKTINPIKFEDDDKDDSEYFYVQCLLMKDRHMKDENEYELIKSWTHVPCAKNILHNLKSYFQNNRNDFLSTKDQIIQKLNHLINIYK